MNCAGTLLTNSPLQNLCFYHFLLSLKGHCKGKILQRISLSPHFVQASGFHYRPAAQLHTEHQFLEGTRVSKLLPMGLHDGSHVDPFRLSSTLPPNGTPFSMTVYERNCHPETELNPRMTTRLMGQRNRTIHQNTECAGKFSGGTHRR